MNNDVISVHSSTDEDDEGQALQQSNADNTDNGVSETDSPASLLTQVDDIKITQVIKKRTMMLMRRSVLKGTIMIGMIVIKKGKATTNQIMMRRK